MLLQRTPLRDTDGTRRGRGPNLGPYERGEISSIHHYGKTPTEIETELGYSREAIRHTLATLQVCNKGAPLLKSGTPI
jgi:hypothetical protein